MSRRKGTSYNRQIAVDPIYKEETVARFINLMMKNGKKSVSQKIFYKAIYIIESKTKEQGIKIFQKALQRVKPSLEVSSRRIGGVTYQVPREVRAERTLTLSIRWLVAHARERKEHGMPAKLAGELMEAAKGQGGSVKRRNDTHRMAEANKAFSHYRW